MDELKINVYDEDDNVIKVVAAQVVDLRFGTIRSLMELLNVDEIEDSAELFTTVYAAWGKITKILAKVFPEMQEEDWDGVKLSELLPLLVKIMKGSLAQILKIPTEDKEKN